MSLRSTVLSGLRWTAGARVIGQIFSWLATILVIRLLTPEDYGIIAIGGFFILYLLLLSEGGFSDALVRQPNLTERMLQEVQAILFVINGLCCLLLIAGSPLIADYFNEPMLRQVLPVLAVQFLIISFAIIPQAQLTREMRFKEISTVHLVQTVLVSVLTLALAFAGAGVWSLVVSNLGGLLFKSVVLLRITRKFHVPAFAFREARVFTGFSGYVLLDRTVWHFYSSVDALVVSRLLGTAATGLYSVAQNLASLPISKVAGVLGQVALPAFAHIQSDAKRVYGSYLLAMRAIAIYAFPIGFGLAAVAEPLVDLVLGEKWLGIVTVFQILALSIPFRLMSSFDSPLLLALGLPQVMLQNRLLSLGILVVALVIASRWELNGVAAAWAVGAPLIWALTTMRFCRRLEWPTLSVLMVASAPFLAALAMLVATQTFLGFFDQRTPLVLRLPLAIAVGAVVYAAAIWSLARQPLQEALGLLKGLIREPRPVG